MATGMIGYITLGSDDLDRAGQFYDAVLATMGARRFDASERFIYYGKRRGLGMLGIMRPHDGQPASAGNGTMVALAVRSRADVERVHACAVSLGAPNEGDPGPRSEGFYGAYFRDPDGNKLCIFTYEDGGPKQP